ncbi:hypothetical protein FN846DRAFT_108300 [Sphaerosporella brunnea]|uniref:Uncharacterized protein n=1 Tax=Sphaerosporella brunnea TaxID=1250544 RepID=A0A5J5ESK1_9PEZI|nr:hypothetical protein FN846DRAFT_108300 [Sphaerosporella brunnea]
MPIKNGTVRTLEQTKHNKNNKIYLQVLMLRMLICVVPADVAGPGERYVWLIGGPSGFFFFFFFDWGAVLAHRRKSAEATPTTTQQHQFRG